MTGRSVTGAGTPRRDPGADAAPAEPPGGLPVFLTSFVGRRGELTELSALLGTHRLLTVAGAGGCGKTRLACEVLATVRDRSADGVRWAGLESVTDPARLGDVVAAATGVLVDPITGPRRALIRGLRGRALVLCLDNAEHVLDACARLVGELLAACPGLTVLVTSREPLGVPGEAVWRMPPMPDAEAMDLFADRARAVHPAYAPDAPNDAAVQTVCRRLDGVPLAIELAAAWVGMLTPAQISRALDDRFRLLVRGPRGVVPRQQSLAASVEWSHDLLDDDARVLLRRLARFSGGFTLEAAEAVCPAEPLGEADVRGALRRLVDASMCQVDVRAGVSRYRLLETIREYAATRLAVAGELDAVRDRHLGHFLRLAESAAERLDHDDQDAVLAALEAEHDNLRAALEWGLSRPDADRGCRLAAALTSFWFLHGHSHEGIQVLRRAAARPGTEAGLQGRLLSGLALLAIPGGRLDLLDDASRRAIDLGTRTGDDRVLAEAHAAAAYATFYVDYARAQKLARAAQRHGVVAGAGLASGLAMMIEAFSLVNRHQHDEALGVARTMAEHFGPGRGRFEGAFARAIELWVALYTGDVPRAVTLGAEAVEIASPLADYFTIGICLISQAFAHGTAGQIGEGQRLMAGIISSVDDAGPDVDVVGMSWMAGDLHLWAGELAAAVDLHTQTVRRYDVVPDNWIVARSLVGLADAQRRLGRPAEAAGHADRAATLARSLPAPFIVAAALDQQALLAAAGDAGRAEDLHHEAMRVRAEHGLRTFLAQSLDHLARLAIDGGRPAEGARLLAASDAARARMGYPRPVVDQPEYDALVAAARATLGEAFGASWSAGAALSLADAVAYASRSRGPRRRPQTGWASLTPTEHQVVALVAEGLSNPEIGTRLFIGRSTVKTHLLHVYAKLGVTGRAELAALAARRAATGE